MVALSLFLAWAYALKTLLLQTPGMENVLKMTSLWAIHWKAGLGIQIRESLCLTWRFRPLTSP